MAPRSQAGSDTRRRILEAALETFLRQGYNATTMDAIAAASGTSKGSLYWHFDSKDDLLESAIRAFFEETFVTGATDGLSEQSSASAQLRALSQAIAEAGDVAKGLFHLYLEYWASSASRDAASRLWFDLLTDYQTLVQSIIDGGIAAGEFQPVDAEPLTWALLAMYDGLAAYGMMKHELDLVQIHSVAIETILRGLEAKP